MPTPVGGLAAPSRAVLRDAAAEPVTNLWVLLGPDYSGKSSVISRVAERTGWAAVSYDEEFLGDGFDLVGRLRDDFLTEALRGLHTRFSVDFVVSLLQAAVVFLRDRALAECVTRPVLVDSYYYKILAKCRLHGLVNEQLFAWWRSFPVPQGVIFLDIDASTAWERTSRGAALNGFEHYGDRPSRAEFERFQRDLRRLMLEETRGVLTRVVGPGVDLDELVNQVNETVEAGG
jgi:thymidylate kinase